MVKKVMGMRLFACIAVAMMMATPFAFVADCGGAGDGSDISSNESVVIKVDEDFDHNKAELEKLGITDSKCYAYDGDMECYVLTLDNVSFRTSANAALVLVAESQPKFVMKLVGDNSIISGQEKGSAYVDSYKSVAVSALHITPEGEKPTDFNLMITGDGTLSVGNVIEKSDDIRIAYGFSVRGTLEITDYANVIAQAGDVNFVCDGITEADVEVYSVGVAATTLAMIGDESMPTMTAKGGDVMVSFKSKGSVTTAYTASMGVCVRSIDIESAKLTAMGGDTDWSSGIYGKTATDVYIITKSSGIGGPFEAAAGPAKIVDSKVVGIGGDAKADDMATSAGIRLDSTSATIVIKNSRVIGKGGNIECIDKKTEWGYDSVYAGSDGIVCVGNTEITDSLIIAMAKGMAYGPYTNQTYNCGLFARGTMSISGSIVMAEAETTNSLVTCYGIRTYENYSVRSLDITIADSEIYATGTSGAINSANGSVNVNGEKRTYDSIAADGTRTPITTAVQEKAATCIEIEYLYDVIYLGPHGICGFERVSEKTYTVEEYDDYVPEGMVFDSYYVNGAKADVGSTYAIDDPLIVELTFREKAKDSGGDSNWVIYLIVGILVILIVAAIVWLLIARGRK